MLGKKVGNIYISKNNSFIMARKLWFIDFPLVVNPFTFLFFYMLHVYKVSINLVSRI